MEDEDIDFTPTDENEKVSKFIVDHILQTVVTDGDLKKPEELN